MVETLSDIERRHVVVGHKYGEGFREVSPCYGSQERCESYYQQRIDNPPTESWQPTIISVTHEQRTVTRWVTAPGTPSTKES